VTFPKRTHPPLAILAASVAALAVVLPAAADSLLGKREFQRRGNAICAAYYVKLNRIPKPQTTAELVPYLQKTLALASTEMRQLKALKPPSAYARSFARMLALARAEDAAGTQLIAALQTGDAQQAQTLAARLDALDRKYNAAAKSIGLNVCGQATSNG